MKQYLDILAHIMDTCTDWRMNRTGVPDIGLPDGAVFKHDMADGFPLMTTKRMGLKNIATELEFFIKGITDKKWLQDRKCFIWNEWASPAAVEKKLKENPDFRTKDQVNVVDEVRDLGPIYGFLWRHFGGKYQWDDVRIDKDPTDNFDRENPGVDQLRDVIYKLHNNPADRRMIVSAWNPADIPQMGLPPCHYSHQLIVREDKLSLTWTQRSCDMFLGVPYNIAGYALLLLLYAKEGGFRPHILKGELHDVHIYQNHVDQVKEQISRTPYKLTTVEITNDNWKGMLDWQAGDFVLKDYVSHAHIKAPVAR